MERYSIFGSNTDTEYLLKLQNNESNIKIDIHNRDHNFTIDYVSSNEIITEYNTLGLKDITRIDENNYIHKSILNSSNVIIQGEYDGNQNDINNIYFSSVANFLISETLPVSTYSRDYFDSNIRRVASDYNEYIATNTYNNRLTSEQKKILDQYKFYNTDLIIIEKTNLNGALLHINFTNKNNVSGYQFYGYNTPNEGVFPYKIKFYQVFNKNAYFFYENIFDTYDEFIAEHSINNNSFVSDELIIQVESVLIDNNYFQNEKNEITRTERTNTDEVFVFSDDYRLAMRFNGIKLFTTNERLINEYDIDMYNNSIQNVNTLTVDKLILNNVVYTDVVSSNRVLETVNEVISTDPTIKYSIVEGYFDEYDYTMLNSLDQTFNPARIQNIESNIRSNLDTKYIPYVYTKYDDDSVIQVEYDSNVNIKYLLNLSELDNTDKLMKHSNGIIYKENKVDNLEITSNLTILSNLEVKGDININSNILRWNNDIDKFTHLDGKIIQDDVIDMLSYEPKINKDQEYTINFNREYDAFTLTYSNNDKPYYIRHPFNFVFKPEASGTVDLIESIYSNSLYSIEGESFDCNLKIQFLDLNAKLNLYISSRFGNEDNRTQEASRGVLNYVSRTSDPQNIENGREIKLIYSNNEYSSNYYDYYEYEVPEKVLLKQISFYDIEFEDYDNLLKNYYQDIINNLNIDGITDIESIPDLYTYPNKNYLNNFAIIGYDNGWELIQHITFENEKTVNQHKEVKIIDSNKKYSRYRIALKESQHQELPFIIKDLKFHIEYTKNNKNILYNGDNINFNIANTLSINNSIRWNDYFNTDDKIRTKLIINEDQPSIKDYYELSATGDTIPYAVCHINENVDDSNLLENHMLKFGLFNTDVPLPSADYTAYSLSKNTPSVYHSLHLMNSNLYYTQSVINNFQDVYDNPYHNEFLILTENKIDPYKHTGLVGINIDKTSLSNIVNHTSNNISEINGLIVNPTLRLCAFNPSEYNMSSYMDIELNENLTIENSYKIILPNNSSSITNESAYYLKPSADHINKIITTEWDTLGSEVFSKPNIFIGNPNNSNIVDKGFTHYSNTNKDTGTATEEYLTHIRKLLVGYPDDLPLDKINSNVLTVGGSVYATHDVSTDSDISYKYNLEKIEDVRYKVEQLNGYTFDRNDTNDNRRYCGLIAQEIEKVIPEVIVKKHDGKMRVLYNNLAGLFVECFKDLYKEIDELKKEVRSHKVGL
jgi:hypothetical protein